MEKVDVGALVTRLVERQRARMQKANVKAHIEIKPRTPVVLGNPRALEQVFLNLITNATQALSEKGGTVAIKVQPVERGGETRFVEIDIADNGPGIPKELQERLFRPFFTTKPDGTGLGLAITKRIVTAHRGNIKVNSFPGGTIFQVQLPAKESV
jgi:signal transduction histidine kinase